MTPQSLINDLRSLARRASASSKRVEDPEDIAALRAMAAAYRCAATMATRLLVTGRPLDPDNLIREVTELFGPGWKSDRDHAYVRRVAAWLLVHRAGCSLADASRMVGRDRATIRAAVNTRPNSPRERKLLALLGAV